MESKTYYYARVSSKTQNLDRQIDAFLRDGADEHDILTEKASGKDRLLILDVPDRHGSGRRPDFITGYVEEAIGLKL